MRYLTILCRVALTISALSGCTAQIKTAAGYNATSAATVTYNCSYFSGYDDLATCQSTNQASCTSTYETFPTGGLSNCFFPVAGYQACLVTPQTWDWVYTTYSNWCDTGTVDGSSQEIYSQSRSIVECSSSICICGNPQTLTRTCSGAADCGSYTPNALTVLPTPVPCL